LMRRFMTATQNFQPQVSTSRSSPLIAMLPRQVPIRDFWGRPNGTMDDPLGGFVPHSLGQESSATSRGGNAPLLEALGHVAGSQQGALATLYGKMLDLHTENRRAALQMA